MWGHIEETIPKLEDPVKLAQWETYDARIIYQILRSVDPRVVLDICPYKTAKRTWDYLKRVYNKKTRPSNFSWTMKSLNALKEINSFRSIILLYEPLDRISRFNIFYGT